MKKALAKLCVPALLAGLVLALSGPEAAAQNAGAGFTVSDYFAAKDHSQTINFPHGVVMTTMTYNIITGFRPFTMDVYKPAGNAVHPGLLFIHGGNWVSGNTRAIGPFGDFPGVLAAIAAQGYVVASIDYRLSSEAKFPAALMDVKTAIRFMRSHAREWNLDDTRIASWGGSAGGYLAVMAGLTCGVASFEPPPDVNAKGPVPSDCVQASIDWSGLLVLEHIFTDFGKPMPATSVEGQFLGCEPNACPAELLRASNPMTYISAKSPPMLIQQGGADPVISPKQPQDLYSALRAQNVTAEIAVYPGTGYDFVNPSPPPGGLTADTANDQAVMDKVMQFLAATFPQKR